MVQKGQSKVESSRVELRDSAGDYKCTAGVMCKSVSSVMIIYIYLKMYNMYVSKNENNIQKKRESETKQYAKEEKK